jgi:hypothetical protein
MMKGSESFRGCVWLMRQKKADSKKFAYVGVK